MRILVTGGVGFIGSHLVKKLRDDGHEVMIVDFRHTEPLDIRDSRMLEYAVARLSPEAVVHLAAKKRGDVDEMFWTNVVGTRNLINALKLLKVAPTVVFSSTSAVYGGPNQWEGAPCQPTSMYGKSKLANEREFLESGLPTKVLRFFNVYGEGGESVVNVIDNCLRKEKGFTVYNRGVMLRDYLPVQWIVKAMCHAIEDKPSSMVVNVGSGHGTSVMDLVRLTGQFANLEYCVEERSVRKDTYDSMAHTEKLKDWMPEFGAVPVQYWADEVMRFWKR